MKLYLSSYKLGNDPNLLAAIVGDNKRAAVIVNAGDMSDEVSRKEWAQQEINALRQLGFEPEELDLLDFFDGTKNLEQTLSKYGLL